MLGVNKLKVGIMQPYFFPYIGYWLLMNAVDVYVVYDDANFIKNGWINRNRILVNNVPSYYNLKLIGASSNKKINETLVNNDERIIRKKIKTIEYSYKKAPFFYDVFPLIKSIINYSDIHLHKYLMNSFTHINKYLGINTKMIFSSDIQKNNNLKGQDKVIEICRLLNGDEYYNAIGGIDLYDKKTFDKNSLKLSFLKTDYIVYKQFNNDFVPNLSIIDVLMFNSKEKINFMLNQYSLL